MLPMKGKVILTGYGDSAATGATVTATADTRGGSYAMIYVAIQSQANTDGDAPSVQLSHADVTNASSFVTLASSFTVPNTNDAVGVVAVDLRGKKRFLEVAVIPDTNDTNDKVLGTAIMFNVLRQGDAPSSASEMLGSTNGAAQVIP